MTQEVLRAVALGVIKHLVGRTLFDDNAAVHKDDAVGHVAGEAHLVRDHDHRHAAARKLLHDTQDIAHELGVECARRLVE